MPEFEITRQIEAAVEAVWSVLHKFGDIHEWSGGVTTSNLTSEGPVTEEPTVSRSASMRGHLVIADISGYTQFLTDSELEHGDGVVADLLNAIVAAMAAPLAISGIEGDAIFMYGELSHEMSGQTVLESVELMYCAFKAALDTMVQNTTCQCNACVNISGLGLKIVMHCGEYSKQTIGGMTTLSGPDVIAVHRLLKNRIVEETGIADYFLVTDQCVSDLGVEKLVASWTPHTEEYEHIGVVAGYVSSLLDVWEYQKMQTEVKVRPEEAWSTLRAQTVAPPATVWDQIFDPLKRTEWIIVAESMETKEHLDGRVVPGTEFHCAHGGGVAVFTVLDMRPFTYGTVMVEFAEGSLVKYTYYLIPSGSGTRIVLQAAAPMASDGEPMPELSSADYLKAWEDMMEPNLASLTAITDELALAFAPAG
ncbi:MAG: DUF2652 domain-containing protein [Actinomycetota bacterium]|nr:DUF2652 domain-containing protein [Actinomycetota bacterium]